jgi:hypothetical protein
MSRPGCSCRMLQRIQYDLRLFIPSLLGHPIRRLAFEQWIGVGNCRNLNAPESVSVQRKRTASPGRFRGHPPKSAGARQTYTFTRTFSQLREITCFICCYLRTNAKHLKSADLYRSWGLKSPSGHHRINRIQLRTLIERGTNFGTAASGALVS